MNREQITMLCTLAALVRDARVAAVAAANARCEVTAASIAALAMAGTGLDATDDPVRAAQVVLRHETWADQCRATLNAKLARQRVERAAAVEAARQAVGRAEAFRRLADRLAGP